MKHWIKMGSCSITLFDDIVFHAYSMFLLWRNESVSNKVEREAHRKFQIGTGVALSWNRWQILPQSKFNPLSNPHYSYKLRSSVFENYYQHHFLVSLFASSLKLLFQTMHIRVEKSNNVALFTVEILYQRVRMKGLKVLLIRLFWLKSVSPISKPKIFLEIKIFYDIFSGSKNGAET